MANAAVEFMKRTIPGIGTAYTVEEMGAALPENFRRYDRRRLVGLPSTDADGFVQGLRAYFELGQGQPEFSVPRVVAERGDRLCAVITRADYPTGTAIEILSVIQVTPDGRRLELNIDYDVEDEAAAVLALDRLHADLGEPSGSERAPDGQGPLRFPARRWGGSRISLISRHRPFPGQVSTRECQEATERIVGR